MAQPLVKKDDDQDDEGQFPSLKYPCNLNFSPEISICNLALLWIHEPAGSRDNSPFGFDVNRFGSRSVGFGSGVVELIDF